VVERKQWLGEVAQAIAEQHQRFAFARPIRERAGKNAQLAVLSATPSIRPTAATGAPRTLVRNIGSTGTIISEAISVKKLTSPAATTLRGSADGRALGAVVSTSAPNFTHGRLAAAPGAGGSYRLARQRLRLLEYWAAAMRLACGA
jgi:hypothetical protein